MINHRTPHALQPTLRKIQLKMPNDANPAASQSPLIGSLAARVTLQRPPILPASTPATSAPAAVAAQPYWSVLWRAAGVTFTPGTDWTAYFTDPLVTYGLARRTTAGGELVLPTGSAGSTRGVYAKLLVDSASVQQVRVWISQVSVASWRVQLQVNGVRTEYTSPTEVVINLVGGRNTILLMTADADALCFDGLLFDGAVSRWVGS